MHFNHTCTCVYTGSSSRGVYTCKGDNLNSNSIFLFYRVISLILNDLTNRNLTIIGMTHVYILYIADASNARKAR